MVDDAEYLAGLAQLRASWQVRLNADVAQLREAVADLQRGSAHPRALDDVHRIGHRLAGSGPTFGFTELGRAAREVEGLARGLSELGVSPDPVLVPPLLARCAALESAMLAASLPTGAGEPAAQRRGHPEGQRRRIYVVDDDVAMCHEIALHLHQFGYDVECFAELGPFAEACERDLPAAAVIDLVHASDPLAGALSGGVSRLRAEGVPFVFVSARADLPGRLAAVRAGGRGFFPKPVDLASLLEGLEGALDPGGAPPLRVLVVDDDEALAEAYALALRTAGMSARVVFDPAHVLTALAEVRPDVILLDVGFSSCSGDELAAVIRQDPANIGVPIIFVSGQVDAARHIALMRSGGDQFLQKPIAPAALAREVVARSARIRSVQGHLAQDGLTGLLNHFSVRAALDREVARARRESAPLSVAMLDVDNFKSINDRLGHTAGDRVLRNLGWLLRKRLRASDAVGRYGGEEFLAVLPGTPAEAARAVLEPVREAFALAGEIEGGATFSAGIAAFPAVPSSARLVDAADRALYQAKELGKNRIEFAPDAR